MISRNILLAQANLTLGALFFMTFSSPPYASPPSAFSNFFREIRHLFPRILRKHLSMVRLDLWKFFKLTMKQIQRLKALKSLFCDTLAAYLGPDFSVVFELKLVHFLGLSSSVVKHALEMLISRNFLIRSDTGFVEN